MESPISSASAPISMARTASPMRSPALGPTIPAEITFLVSGSNNNFSTGTIGTITNSGTISATGNNGIENDGTITEITNTGTITGAGNSIGIDNDGTITTLNNSQGASSSALTYDGTLPTNYNIIINSGSDYGKITFSNVSGTCNFGINSFPSMTEDTTYSSVIDGLTSSNIVSDTSGTVIVGQIKNNWTLWSA